jgi:hypothetical protein
VIFRFLAGEDMFIAAQTNRGWNWSWGGLEGLKEGSKFTISFPRQFSKGINAAPVGATINVRSNASNEPIKLRDNEHGARCRRGKTGRIWHRISFSGPGHAER